MVSRAGLSKMFHIEFPPKGPITCKSTAKDEQTLQATPALIFTHGSGGDLTTAALVNFASGFANVSPILCFQGNMNIASRTKMFQAVCVDQVFPKALGGRSMGARAAAMATTEETTHLVLVSYPLHTDKNIRDQILLNLSANIKVIFVSGDRDSMCELERLDIVREKMKCESWLVVVKGADHGTNIKPKTENGKSSMAMMTGEVVAKWLEGFDRGVKDATLSWDFEESKVQWSGWETGIDCGRFAGEYPGFAAIGTPATTSAEAERIGDNRNDEVDASKRSKKRRKEESTSKKSAKKLKC